MFSCVIMEYYTYVGLIDNEAKQINCAVLSINVQNLLITEAMNLFMEKLWQRHILLCNCFNFIYNVEKRWP